MVTICNWSRSILPLKHCMLINEMTSCYSFLYERYIRVHFIVQVVSGILIAGEILNRLTNIIVENGCAGIITKIARFHNYELLLDDKLQFLGNRYVFWRKYQNSIEYLIGNTCIVRQTSNQLMATIVNKMNFEFLNLIILFSTCFENMYHSIMNDKKEMASDRFYVSETLSVTMIQCSHISVATLKKSNSITSNRSRNKMSHKCHWS